MKKIMLTALMLLSIQSNSMAASYVKLEGFVTKVDDQIHASTNYYFTIDDQVFTVENYDGIQTFKVGGKDLYIELKNQKSVRVGEIDLDISALKNKERTRFNIVEDIEVETIYLNKKAPKIERYFNCGITGCSFGKRKIERTERILSLKVHNGNEFCFYQNRVNRQNGILYPEKCKK